MERLAQLVDSLDLSNSTDAKVNALAAYFDEAPDADKVWLIALLQGKRPKRPVKTTLLHHWSAEAAGLPLWFFERTYENVGDLAECIALILPEASDRWGLSLADTMDWLQGLRDLDEATCRSKVQNAWHRMRPTERFVFNKLITGGFRIGISQKLMTRALAKSTGVEEDLLAHRSMGDWDPQQTGFGPLILRANEGEEASRPYPFFLAYGLEVGPETLGDPSEWWADRKWDGIRCQLIRREDGLYIWSRGEELITDRYPELHEGAYFLPNGTVLDGELMAWKDGAPLSFQMLQKRIGRKNVGKKSLQEAPVALIAFDLLEADGQDLREQPFEERRQHLERMMQCIPDAAPFMSAEEVPFEDWSSLWDAYHDCRNRKAEGLMLKERQSPYRVGRKKGGWWKWKVEPLTVDGVLIYSQKGRGKRAGLYTDHTFAVWKGGELVPFAKAYSGLNNSEIREVDRFVKRNTRERFGPVRSVKPELVFEIAFEGIALSQRHKCGVAVRFPRIQRWRQDLGTDDADRLEDLKEMLERYG